MEIKDGSVPFDGKSRVRRLLFVLILFNAGLIGMLFGRFFYTPDTPCYVSTARLVVGLPGGRECDLRILKPLPLILPGVVEKTTGLDAQYGFLLQNLLFYFLASFLLFEIIRMVFGDEWQAFWGTIIFITAPPVLLYGLAYMTDMPGWFFGILGTYLTLKLRDSLADKAYSAVIIGCISGVGFLWKESAITGAVFFAVYVLLAKLPRRAQLSSSLYCGLGFIVPVLIASAIVYDRVHITFWNWYEFNRSKPYGDYYRLSEFIREIPRTLYVPWFLFLAGLGRFLRTRIQADVAGDRLRFLVASGATVLLWPIWPTPLSRVFYLSSPFLAVVASYGAGAFAKDRAAVLVVVAVLFNYLIVGLWAAFAIRGLVYLLGLVYLVLMAYCWYYRGIPEGVIS